MTWRTSPAVTGTVAVAVPPRPLPLGRPVGPSPRSRHFRAHHVLAWLPFASMPRYDPDALLAMVIEAVANGPRSRPVGTLRNSHIFTRFCCL